MTESQKSRIAQSIAECNAYIAKEAPRNPSLRPAETAQLLDFYYKHREKLQKMLDDAAK